MDNTVMSDTSALDNASLLHLVTDATASVAGVVGRAPTPSGGARRGAVSSGSVSVAHDVGGLVVGVRIVAQAVPLQSLAMAVRRAVAAALVDAGAPVARVDVSVVELENERPKEGS
jgi:hypothetical protein